MPDVGDRSWDRSCRTQQKAVADSRDNPYKEMTMNKVNFEGDGLGRRRRRRKSKGLGRKHGKRRGRKICIRTASGAKACGVRWRRRKRK